MSNINNYAKEKEIKAMGLQEFMKPSLLEITYRKIKDDIIFGRLEPGQRLVVSELSKEFGISHTPINEALNRLVTEGLVEAIPRKGMQVKKISWEEIEDIIETRVMCETFCVEPAIAEVQRCPEILMKFEDSIRSYEKIVIAEDLVDNEKHVEMEMQFHLLYVSLCGNKKIIQIYESLKANQYALYAYTIKKVPLSHKRYIEIIKEHKEIYKALAEYNAEKLRKAIITHINNVENDIRFSVGVER